MPPYRSVRSALALYIQIVLRLDPMILVYDQNVKYMVESSGAPIVLNDALFVAAQYLLD